MSFHRLSTIQDTLVGYLTAEAAKVGSLLNGITIIREQHGHADPSAAFESAMTSNGLAIMSWSPYAVKLDEISHTGATLIASLPVFLVVNPVLNAAALNRNPLQIVEAIWAAAIRQHKGPQIRLGGTPLELIDEDSGIRSYPIDFEVVVTVAPTS